MKVLFQSRLDIFDQKGGDTVQMVETQKALKNLGVDVDIDCSLSKDLSNYDLVHIFNLDWVCEPYLQIKNAKAQSKKVILSPIHHSLSEFELYEKKNRYGLVKFGNILLPSQSLRDVARNLIKGIIYPTKLKPAVIQLFVGIRNQQKWCVQNSDYLIVQTKLEAFDLKNDYKTEEFNWKKVVNGINPQYIDKSSKDELMGKYVLCVGRIEPRKNQIKLISAFNKLNISDTSLVFVGGLNLHHPSYVNKFKNMLGPNVQYLGYVDHSKLFSLYKNAACFAIPSWFETTGLVYLEAAVSGCKSLVASGDRSREYLGDNALYADPADEDSISAALKIGISRNTVKKGFAEYVKKEYTWENAAKQTLNIYKEVLNV